MVWRLPILFENPKYRPSSSCDALPADRRNKTLECILATLNVSSAIMSHALEQIQADRIGVICQIASSNLSTSCLHGYSVSFGKMRFFREMHFCTFFWEAIFATPPIVLTAAIHTLLWIHQSSSCCLQKYSFPLYTWPLSSTCFLQTAFKKFRNASSAIMSHALEQIQAARIGVICQIASSKLSTSCLHGYSVCFGKMRFFREMHFCTFSGRRYSQHRLLS